MKLHSERWNNFTKMFELATGDNISLECRSPIYQEVNLNWYNEKGSIDAIDVSTKYSRRSRMSEIISEDDDGIRYCSITNGGRGRRMNLKETLSYVANVVKSLSPKINLTTTVAEDWMQLECSVAAYPLPTVNWFKDGERLSKEIDHQETLLWNREQFFQASYSFNVSKTELGDEERNYSCTAENDIALNVKSIKISAGSFEQPSLLIFSLAILVVISIVLLIITSAAFYIKNRRDKKKILVMKETGLLNFEIGDLSSLNLMSSVNDQADLLPYNREFEFPQSRLKMKEQLGAGAFGVVTKAIAEGIRFHEEETVVAVKKLDRHATNEMMKILISELKIMIHLGQHLNIVNVLGAVTKNIAQRNLMLITEFCCYGNLQDFLRNHRDSFVNQIVDGEIQISALAQVTALKVPASGYVPLPMNSAGLPTGEIINLETICKGLEASVNSNNLLSWSFQVARGMDYLASRKVLHGDLAARNVLLAEDNVVKICDFGLAKSLYKSFVYKRKEDDKTPLPMMWMALESITDRAFSVYSDVWAYGEPHQLTLTQ